MPVRERTASAAVGNRASAPPWLCRRPPSEPHPLTPMQASTGPRPPARHPSRPLHRAASRAVAPQKLQGMHPPWLPQAAWFGLHYCCCCCPCYVAFELRMLYYHCHTHDCQPDLASQSSRGQNFRGNGRRAGRRGRGRPPKMRTPSVSALSDLLEVRSLCVTLHACDNMGLVFLILFQCMCKALCLLLT